MKPSSQPRAWLEIMASALTTDDEKNEAMEEILILVKDKVNQSSSASSPFKNQSDNLCFIFLSIY